MKKIFLSLLLLVPTLLYAYDAEIDGIYYNFKADEAEVAGADYTQLRTPGSLVIPSSVSYKGRSYSVTSIGEMAFNQGVVLTSIEIPSSVSILGAECFFGCTNLKDVILSDNITDIDHRAFGWCTSLKEFSVPASVTHIGIQAFSGCKNLESVVICDGENELRIEGLPFQGCCSLTDITIPARVKIIDGQFEDTPWHNMYIHNPDNVYGNIVYINDVAYKAVNTSITNCTFKESTTCIVNGAFDGCSELSNVSIPDNVTRIGDGAFNNCRNLTSLRLPDSLKELGGWAFSSTSISEIEIPRNLTNVTFGFCLGSNIEKLTVDANNPVYDSRNNCNAIIETATNTLVIGCKNTVIPYGITSIGTWAFAYRDSNGSLTNIDIPNSVTSIEGGAFLGNKLTSITIPSSVTYIASTAFQQTQSEFLESIVIEEGNPVYDSRDNCNAIIETSTNTLILGCKNSTIPEGIRTIAESAFSRSGLTNVTIPCTVTSIEHEAFWNCDIADLKIPDSVTKIADNAFSYCFSLNSISLTENLEVIEGGAFRECPSLKKIAIPASVTTIGGSAFEGCENLSVVACLSETVPNLSGGYVFARTKCSTGILYVPKNSIKAYQEADQWKDFGMIEAIENMPEGEFDPTEDTDISTFANAIYVNETESHAGESVVLSVKMKNSVEVSGLQCNVYLPEGMEVTKVARGQRLKARDDDDEYIFSFDNSVYEDGSRFILAYTSKDAVVEGNDGEIATMTLNIPETMEAGDYPIIIKNTELSKDGSSTEVKYVKSTLRIVDYKLGDANGDDKLSVADLTSIASHLLGRTPDNFVPKAADANNDGKVSVSDITAIARMLLDGNNARVRTLFTEEVE